MEAVCVEIKAKAGASGKMYGAVSTKQIEEELFLQHKLKIDKRKVIDNESINAFGTYLLKVELYKNIIGTIKVHISEE